MPAPQAEQERRARMAGETPTPEQIAEAERVERERVAASSDNTNTNTDGPRVTITREEFNELQAAKDRLKAAELKADGMRGDLAALTSRLTELEEAAKDGSNRPATARASASTGLPQTAEVPLTDKEKADFEEDAIAMMEKIANNVFSRRIEQYTEFVKGEIGSVKTIADTAAKSVTRVSQDGYTAQVRQKVAEFSDFDKITSHQHWPAFTESEDDLSGFSYAQLIQSNLDNKKVEPMVRIFKKFFDRYLKDETNTDGYAGSVPTGTTNVETSQGGTNKVEILKWSDRQKAQQDYLAQPRRITYDDYEIVRKKFDEADREGRVDYSA